MKITGIGVICSRGLGIAGLEKALLDGWQKPAEVSDPKRGNETSPAYVVDLDALPDKTLLKKIRRADKLSKMSVVAAADALADSGIDDRGRNRVGVIIATAFGAHVTTFSFLDDILEYGDGAVSPTTFSNSVHNAAASYVSSSLNIKGPTLTVTQFRFSFQEAMQLARTWLDQKRCEHVLVGAVDQYGDVLGYVADQKLTRAHDGRIKPFMFKPTCHVPGEGATFFVLSREDTGKSYCNVRSLHTYDDPFKEAPVDINIIDADGMLSDESAYRTALAPDIPVAAYSPLFGSMMISSAFSVAVGALMLKQQMHYAVPVQDNPFDLRLLVESRKVQIASIRCVGFDCYGERAAIYLAKA